MELVVRLVGPYYVANPTGALYRTEQNGKGQVRHERSVRGPVGAGPVLQLLPGRELLVDAGPGGVRRRREPARVAGRVRGRRGEAPVPYDAAYAVDFRVS